MRPLNVLPNKRSNTPFQGNRGVRANSYLARLNDCSVRARALQVYQGNYTIESLDNSGATAIFFRRWFRSEGNRHSRKQTVVTYIGSTTAICRPTSVTGQELPLKNAPRQR